MFYVPLFENGIWILSWDDGPLVMDIRFRVYETFSHASFRLEALEELGP